MLRSIALLLAFLPFSLSLMSQSWSGILAPARAISWTSAGVQGGIPTVTTACATQPTLGSNNTTNVTNINNAINADMGGSSPCVINLPSGTYHLAGTILFQHAGKANVVLRGAGASSTYLIFDSFGADPVGFGPTGTIIWNNDDDWPGGPDYTFTWTASNYAQGATTINVSSDANMKVGSILILDQTDPSSDTGNIWPCQSSGANGDCTEQGTNLTRPSRSEFQSVIITSCGTSTFGAACTSDSVTFTPGLYSPQWSSSRSPGGWGGTSLPISVVGIEDLSLDYSSISTANAAFGTEFNNAANIWVNGVRNINGTASGQAVTEHMFGAQTVHVTIENSYFYGSNPAAEGYGTDAAEQSADWLIQNNIYQHLATAEMMQGAVGVVYGYNYSVDNYFGSGWQNNNETSHSTGDSYNLYEGNEGIETEWDNIHGTSWMQTNYRDYMSGFNPAGAAGGGPYNTALFAYFAAAYQRYDNVVAGVYGTSGTTTTYQQVPSSASACLNNAPPAVFMLGWSDQGGTGFSNTCLGSGTVTFTINNDTLAHSTIMRWGNYDTVTAAVRECTASATPIAACTEDERGDGAPTYPALSSPATTFPASFYLSGTPSWWVFPSGTASTPFPAVGPDVSGGNVANVGGHVYLNPAANCYLKVMGGLTNGTSTALTFSPSSCYSATSSGPGVPTGLGATVEVTP